MIVYPTRKTCHRGFTLIEVMIALAVVGFGILAMLHAMASGTRINIEGRDLTRAVFLTQEVREWTYKLPFVDPATPNNPPGSDGSDPQVFVDDLDDIMDVTYSPPRDANGLMIDGLDEWSQTITIEWVDPDDLLTTVTPGDSGSVRVTALVRRDGHEVARGSWLVFAKREFE